MAATDFGYHDGEFWEIWFSYRLTVFRQLIVIKAQTNATACNQVSSAINLLRPFIVFFGWYELAYTRCVLAIFFCYRMTPLGTFFTEFTDTVSRFRDWTIDRGLDLTIENPDPSKKTACLENIDHTCIPAKFKNDWSLELSKKKSDPLFIERLKTPLIHFKKRVNRSKKKKQSHRHQYFAQLL